MLLAIDIGNTNIVFALFSGETKLCDWRCKSLAGRTADEYAMWLEPLFKRSGYNFSDVNDVIMSTVVPDLNYDLSQFSKKYFQCDILKISITGTGIKPELEIDLDRPEELGADRIVNSVSAIAQYGAPVFVVDFGTATTFDLIDEKGVYRGGAIAPGVNLSLEALHRAAAQLPMISIEKPRSIIARNTKEAMRSGLYWGYVSMVDGMLAQMCTALGFSEMPKVVATGGLAKLFQNDMANIDVVDLNLTLYGLAHIYQHYQETGLNAGQMQTI